MFPCIDSGHLHVGITLKIHNGYSNTSHAKENPKSTWTGRLIWDAKKESAFLANFNSNALQKVGVRAIALIDDNVGQARAMFTSSLLRASECVKKHVPTGISRKGSLWFDDDCRMAKKNAKSWLGVLKRSGCQPDRPAYEAARKVYKIITGKKKTGCKRKKARRLASFDKDPRSFWRELREVSGRKKCDVSKDITDCEWYEHFEGVFNRSCTQGND